MLSNAAAAKLEEAVPDELRLDDFAPRRSADVDRLPEMWLLRAVFEFSSSSSSW
ncbi:hypothetical protein N9B34_02315 [Akkermansiaceae bacterium]|nr:hypothetical protein [Akkermansiaceae bacterium]